MKLLPQSLLHPALHGDSDGSCFIHVLRRKDVSKDERRDEEVGRGVQAADQGEPHQSQKKGHTKL